MPILESRLVVKAKDETAGAFAEVEKRLASLEMPGAALLEAVEAAKRAASMSLRPAFPMAETALRGEIARLLERNREIDDENARLARKCDALESENRSLA